MDEPKQLRLEFPERAPKRDDLIVTDCNKAAASAAFAWQEWPSNLLCIFGPPSCGLSLLSRIWASDANAVRMTNSFVDSADTIGIRAFAEQNGVIDRADAITNEESLLAAINFSMENGRRLLLTSRTQPASWHFESADLRSRLANITAIAIEPPDDEMVLKRLVSACQQRFIRLNAEEANYIMLRIEKSYVAIEDYVQRLERAATAAGRAPSVHLARSVLEEGADTRKLFHDL
ncbi:MAG: DnaA/Hda family protein [Pseudomonadota bacterium]